MRRAVAFAWLCAAIAAGAGGAAGVPRWTHWLCFPNHPHDWCYVALPTTVISADGSRKVVNVPTNSKPTVDCFYVYPTVSQEQRGNADLRLQPAERNTAIIQAARFSQVCRVFAPLYRQTTSSDLFKGNPQLAYDDVLAAWKDYLAHDNEGRGVVLIGHSQGAAMLERLIREQVEPSATERKLLVSAILLGGDVQVANGSTTGGTFRRVPACTSATETGCVIAYSSWDKTPPAGVGLEGVDSPSEHVLCVNPAALGGGSAPITPIFAGLDSEGLAPYTAAWVNIPWVEFPGLYTARCVRQGGRAWLLLTRTHVPGDRRPTVQEVLGARSGLHAADMNVALENLIELVTSESRSWLSHR